MKVQTAAIHLVDDQGLVLARIDLFQPAGSGFLTGTVRAEIYPVGFSPEQIADRLKKFFSELYGKQL